eukprot:865110-Rhodomonas_salina.2
MTSVDEAIANLFPQCEQFPVFEATKVSLCDPFATPVHHHHYVGEVVPSLNIGLVSSQRLFRQNSFELSLCVGGQPASLADSLDMSMLDDDFTCHHGESLGWELPPRNTVMEGRDSVSSSSPKNSTSNAFLYVRPSEAKLGYSAHSPANVEVECVSVASAHQDAEAPVASGSESAGSAANDSDSGAPKRQRGGKKIFPWSKDEHKLFLVGLERFRKDDDAGSIGRHGDPSVGLGLGIAELISALVGTRTPKQVRSHAQKFFLRRRNLPASSD